MATKTTLYVSVVLKYILLFTLLHTRYALSHNPTNTTFVIHLYTFLLTVLLAVAVIIQGEAVDTHGLNLTKTRVRLNNLLAEYRHVSQSVREEKAVLGNAKAHVQTVLEAQQLVQNIAEQVQHQAHNQIASVVTRCLQAVFGEDAYTFKILFEKKHGKTEARMVFERNGHQLDPKSAAGGGVVEVAAFALRVACLMLSLPRRRKFLALDEPFARVKGKTNQRRAGKLLETLAEEMGIQFLIVSEEWLNVGKIIRLE